MMTTHNVTCQLRGNRVMAQKKKRMEQRTTYHNQEIEEKECFKLY